MAVIYPVEPIGLETSDTPNTVSHRPRTTMAHNGESDQLDPPHIINKELLTPLLAWVEMDPTVATHLFLETGEAEINPPLGMEETDHLEDHHLDLATIQDPTSEDMETVLEAAEAVEEAVMVDHHLIL